MKKILSIVLIWLLGFLIYLGWYVHAGSKFIPPHFHANFAVYVDGERIDFTDEKFSEDIAWCSISGKQEPKDRVHLHERNQETIHIHASWVSWWHFFSNNDIIFSGDNINISEDFKDQSGVFTQTETKKMSFLLNWKSVKNPFNRLINSEDKLLINYGSQSDEEIQELYTTVSSNAGEYNAKYDPGGCGGTNDNGVVVILTEWLHSLHNTEDMRH